MPVWHSGITMKENFAIKRVKKFLAKTILQGDYTSYKNSLNTLKFIDQKTRREKLRLNFALKAEKNAKFSKWFKPNKKRTTTRSKPTKYTQRKSRTRKYEKSSITYLTQLLNTRQSEL